MVRALNRVKTWTRFSGTATQAAEYEKEIQELRWQIQQLQEAGNIKDYSGMALCLLLNVLCNITNSPNNYFPSVCCKCSC